MQKELDYGYIQYPNAYQNNIIKFSSSYLNKHTSRNESDSFLRDRGALQVFEVRNITQSATSKKKKICISIREL